jgi:hypothetical protein
MENEGNNNKAFIGGSIVDNIGQPIEGVLIGVWLEESNNADKVSPEHLRSSLYPGGQPNYVTRSDRNGHWEIRDIRSGRYQVWAEAWGESDSYRVSTDDKSVQLQIPVAFKLEFVYEGDFVFVGQPVKLRVLGINQEVKAVEVFSTDHTIQFILQDNTSWEYMVTKQSAGRSDVTAVVISKPTTQIRIKPSGEIQSDGGRITTSTSISTVPAVAQPISGRLGVTLQRSAAFPTRDQALWVAIRNRTKAIAFSGSGYKDFIDRVLCQGDENIPGRPADHLKLTREIAEYGNQVHGVGAYQLLKTATEVFLLLECGVKIMATGAMNDDPIFIPDQEVAGLGDSPSSINDLQDRLTQYLGNNGQLPYITRVINAAFPGLRIGKMYCDNVLTAKAHCPCLIELIWSYWHEEGMLAQTLGAISRRFQNVRAPGDRDPLAHLEIDPLRPLNNILWGYIQDEQNRLSVRRRAYEYDHQYGLTLYGKAAPRLRSADRRSKFLEGFHNVLNLTSTFYKEDNDTTVIADGFPLLNALKEVHLTLAQGAHNQFGDLAWTARAEMLMQEWILARPEMRDFLQSRAMVPYKEAWMPQVDTMKTLQGWSDVTVTHFRDLGVYGEQILLSIRLADWMGINDEDSAKNWARYWRPEIQSYLHAYRAVTGIDLTNPDTVDATMPAIHLQKRLAAQQGASR